MYFTSYLLSSVVLPQTCHLQYAGVSTVAEGALFSVASPTLSSGTWPCHMIPSLSFSPLSLQSWGCHCNWDCIFTSDLLPSHSAKPQLLHDLWDLHCNWGCTFTQWPFLASPSTRPQLLSMTRSCLQNQCHVWDSYTSFCLAASLRCSLGLLCSIASICWLFRNFEEFTSMLLISCNHSWSFSLR